MLDPPISGSDCVQVALCSSGFSLDPLLVLKAESQSPYGVVRASINRNQQKDPTASGNLRGRIVSITCSPHAML